MSEQVYTSVLVYMLYGDRVRDFNNVIMLNTTGDTVRFTYEIGSDDPTVRPEATFYKANIAGIDVLKKKGA